MRTRAKHGRVTVSQLARRLRLSSATVSFVLNGRAEEYRIPPGTAERVRQEALRLNYHPSPIARQLAGMRSNVVGVLVHTEATADARLIQKMEMLAAERGIRFMVGHVVGKKKLVKEYLDDFRARAVDAVIAIFHNHPDYAAIVLPELAKFDRVLYYEQPIGPAGDNACYVAADFYEVGRLGAQHLVDRGRQRIAILLNDLIFPYSHARLRAYKDVLEAADREVDDRLIWVMDERTGVAWSRPFTSEMADEAVESLVAEAGADGIVVVDDAHAARTIVALEERGFGVPRDVAVVGCNDWDLATMIRPQLTSINLRTDALAQAMTDMLFEMLDGGELPIDRRAVVVKPELVQRTST